MTLKNKIKGFVLLGICMMSLIYGTFYLDQATSNYDSIPVDYLIFLTLSFALTGISLFFGVLFLVFYKKQGQRV